MADDAEAKRKAAAIEAEVKRLAAEEAKQEAAAAQEATRKAVAAEADAKRLAAEAETKRLADEKAKREAAAAQEAADKAAAEAEKKRLDEGKAEKEAAAAEAKAKRLADEKAKREAEAAAKSAQPAAEVKQEKKGTITPADVLDWEPFDIPPPSPYDAKTIIRALLVRYSELHTDPHRFAATEKQTANYVIARAADIAKFFHSVLWSWIDQLTETGTDGIFAYFQKYAETVPERVIANAINWIIQERSRQYAVMRKVIYTDDGRAGPKLWTIYNDPWIQEIFRAYKLADYEPSEYGTRDTLFVAIAVLWQFERPRVAQISPLADLKLDWKDPPTEKTGFIGFRAEVLAKQEMPANYAAIFEAWYKTVYWPVRYYTWNVEEKYWLIGPPLKYYAQELFRGDYVRNVWIEWANQPIPQQVIGTLFPDALESYFRRTPPQWVALDFAPPGVLLPNSAEPGPLSTSMRCTPFIECGKPLD